MSRQIAARSVLKTEASEIDAWFSKARASLTSRGLWLRGGEPGTMPPAAWNGAGLRVLIVRLSGYHDVATGITHGYLYQMAREVEGVYADLAFLPPHNDELLMRRDGIPLLTGTASKRPAGAFDVIAVSNSVVQELLNLPALLAHSGIPLSRQERDAAGSPLILLGGSNSAATAILHGPIGEAPDGEGLVDGVVIGDGDEAFPAVLRLLVGRRGAPRPILLDELRAGVPGFYDPSKYGVNILSRGRLAGIEAVDGAPFPVRANRTDVRRLKRAHGNSPIWYDEDAAGASHVVVTAGCPSFCSFCKESWEQKPYREREVDDVVRDALELKRSLGLKEIALYTFNANTYTGLMPLLDRLDPLFERVAIKSQRFDAIAKAPALLERQLAAGKRSYTCAMEGISDRLRTFLQKGLSEAQLLAGFDELFRRNVRQMKVFVIVTGFETKPDLEEFAALLSKLRKKLDGLKGRPVITFSFAALFRPPHTPLQYAFPRPAPAEIERFEREIAGLVKKAGFEARTSAGASDAVVSEYLAYGDRRCTRILVEASVGREFRYRGEVKPECAVFWATQMRKANLENRLFPRGDAGEVLPWDDVDVGVSTAFLLANWKMLREGREMASCIRPPWGSGVCGGCGACRGEAERKRTTGLGPQDIGKAQVGASAPLPPKPVRYRLEFEIPRRWADTGNAFLAAALGRALMVGAPGLVESFLCVDAVMERKRGYGHCRADVLFRADNPLPAGIRFPLADTVSDEGGLRILSMKSASGSLAEDIRPLVLVIHGAQNDREAEIAMRIDAMLAKYRYKHQKLWRGDVLHWEIQAGQAKKCGISLIRLPRGGNNIMVNITHWPEAHLIDQIGGGEYDVEVLPA